MKLASSQDARRFAANAARLGHAELEAQARARARELRAAEEGFQSPAERAIAAALYAYEERQSELTGRTFRANRTHQMLDRHGALKAAERMVLNRKPSKGFHVLAEAGLNDLSFEAIVDRFPEEFSERAVQAAQARLEGKAPPPVIALADFPVEELDSMPRLDDEARAFMEGFRDPSSWFLSRWFPVYEQTIRTIEQALAQGRPQDIVDLVWTRMDNGISHAGPGLVAFNAMDSLRNELAEMLVEIQSDPSPAAHARITQRFDSWHAQGRISKVPRLLIARAFAGVHPNHFSTTVEISKLRAVAAWLTRHAGFVQPADDDWPTLAAAVTHHVDRMEIVEDGDLSRNLFPWFIVEQLRGRNRKIKPGRAPRPTSTVAYVSEAQRHVALRHNAIQDALFTRLIEAFGEGNVWTEYPSGTGGFVDALARDMEGQTHLFEIKVAQEAREVVRQAMGQLLEYGYRNGGLNPARLIAVGEPELDDTTRAFLARLREQFALAIEYMQIVVPNASLATPA